MLDQHYNGNSYTVLLHIECDTELEFTFTSLTMYIECTYVHSMYFDNQCLPQLFILHMRGHYLWCVYIVWLPVQVYMYACITNARF